MGGYGISMALRGSSTLLYRDLAESEAALAVQRLNDAGIAAHLGDEGRSVWVGSGNVEQARLALAMEGLPASSGTGFEIFDETGFGMTDFLEQVNYRRALEGEIARTISALDEVASARVHLVLPRESVYSSQKEPAKASVSLRLQRAMEPRSVDAIVHLVSSSVEGLAPESVVVVDSHGRTLHASGQDESGETLSADQLVLKSRIEGELAGKAVAILEPLVGEGRVRAKATVDMDFDRSEETVETYDPEGTVVRSQRLDEQRDLHPDAALARGVPGTRSNPPEDDAAQGATAEAPVEEGVVVKKSETINYEVSKRIRRTSTPTGKLLRRSVAVVVDNPSSEDAATGTEADPTAPAAVDTYRQLVIAALGLDVDGGDVVTVESLSFDGLREAAPLPEPSTWEKVRPILSPLSRNLSWVLLLGAFYFVLFKPVMRKLSEPSGPKLSMLPEVRDAYGALGAGAGEGLLAPGEGGGELAQRAQMVTQRSPEMASEFVRGWLEEE